MSSSLPFITLAANGLALPDEIDDYIDEWHDATDSRIELHEFLGMTKEEYSLFVAHPSYINLIITARVRHQSIRDAVNDNLRIEERLAARSADTRSVALLRRWIASQVDR